MSEFRDFLLKRIAIAVGLAFVAVTIIFFIMRFAPGTPYSSALIEGNLNQGQIESMEASYGLGAPIHIQYINYLENFLTFNFGYSLSTGKPVMEYILPKLFNTLVLLIPALVFTALISSLIGFYVGWNRGSRLEKLSIVFSTIFRSMPEYITGILLLMVFSYWLGFFPVSGMRSPTAIQGGFQETYLSVDFLKHYALPFTTAALYLSGDFLLLARNGVVEKKNAEFIKLHKAKGLSELEQLLRAGQNSLLPIVTYFALRLGWIFQGLILLEVVFGWPGMGRLLVNAVIKQDYPTVQTAIFIMALAVILGNLVADILTGYFDPKVSIEG